MYEAGGMFVKHRDTLHAPNHYATLIVGFPSDYTGGEFVLELSDGSENQIDMKTKRSNKFVIFLTDMPHYVKKVETGVRIVLQYDVYLEDDVDAKVEAGEKDSEENSEKYSDEEEFGVDFSCNGFYAKTSVRTLTTDNEHASFLNQGRQDLLPALEEFIAAHPQEHISFLLTHAYPG